MKDVFLLSNLIFFFAKEDERQFQDMKKKRNNDDRWNAIIFCRDVSTATWGPAQPSGSTYKTQPRIVRRWVLLRVSVAMIPVSYNKKKTKKKVKKTKWNDELKVSHRRRHFPSFYVKRQKEQSFICFSQLPKISESNAVNTCKTDGRGGGKSWLFQLGQA